MSKNFLKQIEQELEKPENRNIAALVNESTEQIHAFIAPRPYWQTNDAADTGILDAAEVQALETEKAGLIDSLPRLSRGERSKATTRINVIEETLRRARSNEESARTDRERETERKQEQGGTPPASVNTPQAVNWSALDMATQTDLIQATMKELRRAGVAK